MSAPDGSSAPQHRHPRPARGRWWSAVLTAHRWLGTAGAPLFLLWFASGFVMMYARMPALDPGERLRRLEPLDLSAARVAPGAVWGQAGSVPDRLRLGMLAGRPVYRAARGGAWEVVFADDGSRLSALDRELGVEIAARFRPDCRATVRFDRRLVEPDQWTLQLRPLLPMQRIVCGDAEQTVLYVSERLGEVALVTTRRDRLWGYLGAVGHWLYLTPLRRHTQVWLRLLIVLSALGTLLAVSGVVIGWRQLMRRRASPYSGWLRWHHVTGLAFGGLTFTWVLSGCLSLDPLGWGQSTAPSPEQRRRLAGGALRLGGFDLGELQRAAGALERSVTVRELELHQVGGELRVLAYQAPAAPAPGFTSPAAYLAKVQPLDFALATVPSGDEEPVVLDSQAWETERDRIVAAAATLVSGAQPVEMRWLERYDAYYTDRHRRLPLPVLRVRYADAQRTWLYLEPRRGVVLRRERRGSRLDRWLYHGLHSLDLFGLYELRPLWDVVVIVLLAGGLLSAASAVVPATRRLRRRPRRTSREVGVST